MLARCSGFALALAVSAALTACGERCRTDLDCPSDEGLMRCEPTTGTCAPLPPNAPAVCADHSECAAGRLCVVGECRFAPSCQSFWEGASFHYLASCLDGTDETEQRGVASPAMNGCQVSFTLEELFGAEQALVLQPISATFDGDPPLSTAPGGIPCAGGSWSSPRSSALLRGCTLDDGAVCDVALLRLGEGEVCMVEEGCGPGVTCVELTRVDDAIAGVCE